VTDHSKQFSGHACTRGRHADKESPKRFGW